MVVEVVAVVVGVGLCYQWRWRGVGSHNGVVISVRVGVQLALEISVCISAWFQPPGNEPFSLLVYSPHSLFPHTVPVKVACTISPIGIISNVLL